VRTLSSTAGYLSMQRVWRYAQEKGGQQLHLVEEFGGGQVANVAVCGRTPKTRWRMTINVPLGQACKTCRKRLSRIRWAIAIDVRKGRALDG